MQSAANAKCCINCPYVQVKGICVLKQHNTQHGGHMGQYFLE